jgi:hypothetical protein
MEPEAPAPAQPAPEPAREITNTSTITLSDNILIGIAARPDMRALFPMLKPVVTPGGKKCCGAAKAAQQAIQGQLDAMKVALTGMDSASKAKFKQMLKVGQVTMYISGGRFSF